MDNLFILLLCHFEKRRDRPVQLETAEELPRRSGASRDLLQLLAAAARQSAPAAVLASSLRALSRGDNVKAYGAVLGQCAVEKMLDAR